MSGIDEHADGELGDVPAATDATPSVSTGNVSRLRKGYGPRPNATSAAVASSVEELQAMRRALEEERSDFETRKKAQEEESKTPAEARQV